MGIPKFECIAPGLDTKIAFLCPLLCSFGLVVSKWSSELQ